MHDWHSAHGGREWRVTPEGIECRDPDGITYVPRTRGEPWSVRRYLAYWREPLRTVAEEERVPISLLLMVIATENGPARVEGTQVRYKQIRAEPGYVSDEDTPHRISVGPCHLLISTARDVMDDPEIDRSWLSDVGHNLRACGRYIRWQRRMTGLDPIKVAAAYNAGGLYRALPGESSLGNAWHLRTYGEHLDRAAAWYGDAAAVLQEWNEVAELEDRGLGRVRAA